MKTLWKGHAIPLGWFGLILSAVYALFLFLSCPLSESPNTIPELNGYWFAEEVSVELDPGQDPVDCRVLAIIQSTTIEFLVFSDDGDQLAGMRGTYTKTSDVLNISVTANYNPGSKGWDTSSSQDTMPYELGETTLVLDINGPNDTPLTITFTRIGAPARPAGWIGSWSGTWGGEEGAAATLSGNGAFVFHFGGQLNNNSIDLTQTGTWTVLTAFGNTYFFIHITSMEVDGDQADVDFYGLCNATLTDTHATIVTSNGNMEFDKQ